MKYIKSIKVKNDAKRVFYKKGTCSRTFFYLLNREYKHPMDEEEKAVDPLGQWGPSAYDASEECLSADLDKLLNKFYENTDYEMECRQITKKEFMSLDEHTEYIQNGGCKELIEVLAEVKM